MGKIKDSDNWVNDRLGNLPIEFIDGDRSSRYPKKSEMVPNGIPFLNAKSIREGFLNLKKVNFITEDKYSTIKKGRLQYGDLILTTRGNGVGKLAYFGIISTKALINAQLLIVRPDNTKINPRYLYYSFCNPAFQLMLKNFTSGSAQPQLPITSLQEVQFSYPFLATQRKIASILSAYDDLIENNTRRIKILEEMAQALYREWFVEFRFPGHEKVKMVESELGMVPEGWDVKEMKEVGEVIDCLHSKKPLEYKNGTKILLQLFNIADCGKLDISKKYFICDDDYTRWSSRIEASCGDCVITNVGRIAAVAQISEGIKAALGRNMTAIRPKIDLITPTYLIEYLLSPHMEKEVLKKKDSGTIMDSLNVKGILKLAVPVPPFDLMTTYERKARPIRRRIELIMIQNRNLRRTRDLLLPKLISGEVDVSRLDIPTGELT